MQWCSAIGCFLIHLSSTAVNINKEQKRNVHNSSHRINRAIYISLLATNQFSNISTTSKWSFLQALISGVVPPSSLMLTSAMDLISSFIASVQPFSAAQWRREALVVGSISFGFPPFSRSDLRSCQYIQCHGGRIECGWTECNDTERSQLYHT